MAQPPRSLFPPDPENGTVEGITYLQRMTCIKLKITVGMIIGTGLKIRPGVPNLVLALWTGIRFNVIRVCNLVTGLVNALQKGRVKVGGMRVVVRVGRVASARVLARSARVVVRAAWDRMVEWGARRKG